MSETRDWLLVIDLQPAFSDPRSPWFTPGLDEVSDRIATLVAAFGHRVVFTRFVPPASPAGSWRAYYAKWPFALERGVGLAVGARRAVVGATQPRQPHVLEMAARRCAARSAQDEAVVLCGVSTDCCVLMTALAAVDDGAQVRVVEDACAAKNAGVHAGAIAIMAARAPQLRVVTTAEELARR